MPGEWWLWLVGIIVLGGLIFYAVHKKFNVDLSFGDKKLRLSKPEESKKTDEVNVLNESKLGNAEVGKITGLKDRRETGSGSADVNVLNKAIVKDSKVDEITGAEIDSKGNHNK